MSVCLLGEFCLNILGKYSLSLVWMRVYVCGGWVSGGVDYGDVIYQELVFVGD